MKAAPPSSRSVPMMARVSGSHSTISLVARSSAIARHVATNVATAAYSKITARSTYRARLAWFLSHCASNSCVAPPRIHSS